MLDMIEIVETSPKMDTEFKTTHNLPFLSAIWNSPFNIGGHNVGEYQHFKIGTCHGAWNDAGDSYDILVVINDKPGNGHFEDVLQWFENSGRRDKKDFRILEVWNRDFARHLVRERGFQNVAGTDHYIKVLTR